MPARLLPNERWLQFVVQVTQRSSVAFLCSRSVSASSFPTSCTLCAKELVTGRDPTTIMRVTRRPRPHGSLVYGATAFIRELSGTGGASTRSAATRCGQSFQAGDQLDERRLGTLARNRIEPELVDGLAESLVAREHEDQRTCSALTANHPPRS